MSVTALPETSLFGSNSCAAPVVPSGLTGTSAIVGALRNPIGFLMYSSCTDWAPVTCA